MKEILNNQDIPIPEGLEQRLSALIDRLEAEELEMKNEKLRMKNEKLKSLFIPISLAAAFIAVAFLLIVPQVRQQRELARYEGSFVVEDGQRIDDLGQIRADIHEALAMAQVAESNVPAGDFASEAERSILQATDDPEMRAVVQRILE